MKRTIIILAVVLAAGASAFDPLDLDPIETGDTANYRRAHEYFLEGKELFNGGFYKDARSYYLQAIATEPNFPEAQYGLAMADIILDLYIEAETALKKTLELEPEWEFVHGELGTVYYKKGEYGAAAVELSDALEYDPDDAVARYMLAKTYWRLGKYDKAVGEYEKVLEQDSTNIDCYYDMGLVYEEAGDADKAVEAFETFIERAGDDPAEADWVERARKYIMEIKGEI